jgi:hypothetical protein
MRNRDRRIVILLLAGLALPACTRSPAEEPEHHSPAGRVVRGTNQSRVILTSEAAQRLGIQTSFVRTASAGQGGQRRHSVIPYAAVLYDPTGETWSYINTEPLVYVRHAIQIADIRAGLAYLSSGPPAGTPVVTVGAAELLGVEYEVGEE